MVSTLTIAGKCQKNGRKETEQKCQIKIDHQDVYKGEILCVRRPLLPRRNKAQTVQHADCLAFALVVKGV